MIVLGGYSAWITSEGKEIIEYEPVIDSKNRKITCWIACEEDKPFTVHWRDMGGGIETATYIKLDGFNVPGYFLHGSGEAKRDSVRVSNGSERPFIFAKLNTDGFKASEDDDDVGTIVVKIREIKRTEERPANWGLIPPQAKHGTLSIGDTRIDYGDERHTDPQIAETWNTKPHDPSNPGSLRFVFRYRSRKFLVAQGIMSRTDPIYQNLIVHLDEKTRRPESTRPEIEDITLSSPIDTPPFVFKSSELPVVSIGSGSLDMPTPSTGSDEPRTPMPSKNQDRLEEPPPSRDPDEPGTSKAKDANEQEETAPEVSAQDRDMPTTSKKPHQLTLATPSQIPGEVDTPTPSKRTGEVDAPMSSKRTGEEDLSMPSKKTKTPDIPMSVTKPAGAERMRSASGPLAGRSSPTRPVSVRVASTSKSVSRRKSRSSLASYPNAQSIIDFTQKTGSVDDDRPSSP